MICIRLTRLILSTGILIQPHSLLAETQFSQFSFFLVDHLYPHYIANPVRSTFSFQAMKFSNSDIPQSGDQRFGINMGANLGLVRLHPENNPDVGWDGHYALFLDYRHSKKIAYRLGIHHTSSHIGDEYIERTGRQRINYTRQEIRLGNAWSFTITGRLI